MNFTWPIWLTAIRPRTLPLACSAIILGTATAAYDGFFNVPIFALTILTALLLQIISNLANDYGDALSGADNEHRVGPARVMQSGLVSKAAMKKALAIAITAAIVSGSVLIHRALADNALSTAGFVILGLASIAAAINYTMGKSPYGYKGFGDIAVFIFFGLVGVLGSYFLFTQSLSLALLLPASSCGLLSAAVLNINNIRDMDTDRVARKYTLVTRLGRQRAIYYHWALLLGAELTTLLFIIYQQLPSLTWLHILAVPTLMNSARLLPSFNNAPLMNRQLRNTALASFAFCTLLAIGLIAPT